MMWTKLYRLDVPIGPASPAPHNAQLADSSAKKV
jgi:hypothetical protein